eukprot:gb/GEZJ01001519.1/.p1 GENE.gb/GEZJ01001519.1/~~gb/GEZJ01001519.1/.p1  ORF type:complete len:191 (-),score=22.71 gb/GEZJ01001519.1/:491-1063(-)
MLSSNTSNAASLGIFFLLILSTFAGVHSCCIKDYYLAMSNEDIWNSARDGSRIGKCYISSGGSGAHCDLYAKSAVKGIHGDYGWPKSTDKRGTGCVRAPDFPRKVGRCYYSDYVYNLPKDVVDSFCTGNGKNNAVAQIRHAIRNDACGLPQCHSSGRSGASNDDNIAIQGDGTGGGYILDSDSDSVSAAQ